MTYTYILALKTDENAALLEEAIQLFPDLETNRQVGEARKKGDNDVIIEDSVVEFSDNTPFFYVKANTDELMKSGLLSHISDYTLYTKETQPFKEYWLNVNL